MFIETDWLINQKRNSIKKRSEMEERFVKAKTNFLFNAKKAKQKQT